MANNEKDTVIKCQLYTKITSLWRTVSVNVVANSNWSCLLSSAHKVHWRVQPTAARQWHCLHGMCLSMVPPWNCQQMIEKEQRPPNNSSELNGMEILCLGSDTRNYFETFIWSPKQLYRVCLVKAPWFSGSESFWSWWPGWMCLCAFELIFSWRYQECILVSRFKWVGPL